MTVGRVAALAMNFGGPIPRIDPNNTTATLSRVVARKVNPSVVANALGGASIRQVMLGHRSLLCIGTPSVSSEHGRRASPTTSRPISETSVPKYQVSVKERRDFFEKIVSESNKAQTPELLHRSDIPKRLCTGTYPGAVVWTPNTSGRVPDFDGAPSRKEVIDCPKAIKPREPTRKPGPVVNHLANIVIKRKAELQKREASITPPGKNITLPVKFSMARTASSPTPSAPSTAHAHSDYVSDFSGSSSPSSPSGSPDACEPTNPQLQTCVEALDQHQLTPPEDEAIWAEVNDMIRQIDAAIADKNKYGVSDDVIEHLRCAGLHIDDRNIALAHAAYMRALNGMTEIKAVQSEITRRSASPHLLSPIDSAYDSDDEERDDDISPLPQGAIDAWMNARPEFISARDRILATIQAHAGTTWAESAAVLLTKVEAEWLIDRQSAIGMAHDGLESIAGTPRRSIAVKF